MAYVTERDIAELMKARLLAKKSQRDLAKELGVSETYLSDFIRGKRTAGPKVLKGLGYDPTPFYRKAKEGNGP